jgi:glycopeptide antibiotics resistance protein
MLEIVLTTIGLWTFVAQPATLAVLGATLLLAWPISHRFADRYRCPRAAAVAFVITVGVVLALTVTPNEPENGILLPFPPHYLSLLMNDPAGLWAQFTLLPRDAEQVANIALYVPVGLLGVFVWRSTVRAALFGMVLTFAIETCQYAIIGRAGSLTDIRNNTAGAVLGALVATVAWHCVRWAAQTRRPHPAGDQGDRSPVS